MTDLYRKETDRVQYLLPSSCHPNHIFKNVPYSLALRLVRICNRKEDLIKRFEELAAMLISRGYNKNVIENAIERAEKIDRQVALKKVVKVKKNRTVLALTYNPMLPSLTNIVKKHCKTMSMDTLSKEIFPNPPMVAYRQPPNLKQTLCRAKLPTGKRSQRTQVGMKRCNHQCPVCIHMMETKHITGSNKNTYPMTGQFGCVTTSVVYVATCEKCHKQYVGQTGRKYHDRVMEHLRYIKAGKHALGDHYKNSKKCDPNRDLKFQVIEKVYPDDEQMRLHREKFWIERLNVLEPNGLNRRL